MNARNSRILILLISLVIFLFPLSDILESTQIVRADTGPALEESTVIGSIVSPYKFKPTKVRMVDEQVRLKILPVTRNQIIYSQVKVLADFNLYNTSSKVESMQAVFPLTDLKCPWIVGPGFWTFREEAIDEDSFSVSIDGEAVATTPITTTTIITQEFGVGNVMQLECLTQWKQFDVTFPPHQNVKIQVNYLMQPTFELGEGFTGYPWDSFTYILKTGTPWYGSIGQVDISMELPNPVKKEHILKMPPGYRIYENIIRWRWRNLEPKQNFQVVVMSSQAQNDLEKAQTQISSHPDDANAWASLARVYESLAWRYDYQASCGSSIEYLLFFQIYHWKYAWLAQSAYQKLLELHPDDGVARANYANLLAEMSLSGNHGVLLAGYPSVKRVLAEFERTLALEQAERSQQLLGSYKQCILKSPVDPPKCQCDY